MGHTDPEVRDAYRVTAQAINAESARARFVGYRVAELKRALLRPMLDPVTPQYAYSLTSDTVPVGKDFAAWLGEQGDEAVAQAVFSAPDRARLLDQYVQARARVDADAQDWHAEAMEALAWERGGHV